MGHCISTCKKTSNKEINSNLIGLTDKVRGIIKNQSKDY